MPSGPDLDWFRFVWDYLLVHDERSWEVGCCCTGNRPMPGRVEHRSGGSKQLGSITHRSASSESSTHRCSHDGGQVKCVSTSAVDI